MNALKINSAKNRSEEKIKASIEIANLYEENYKLSATVEALSRSLNKRLCQNVTLKEENERYKNEKERLYFLLKYRVTQNDYPFKNTSSEIMTIVDRVKNLEKENIDLINKYQEVLNVLESERENCVQLLKFMFLKTFLAKYSKNYQNNFQNSQNIFENNFQNDFSCNFRNNVLNNFPNSLNKNIHNINSEKSKKIVFKNSFHSTNDVSILCKLENIEDEFNLTRRKMHSDLEIISHRTPLSNLEDLIIVLIRLYKEKFHKEFMEKIDSTVHFQPQFQLNRINKTLETNFHSLPLNSRRKAVIFPRKKKCVTLSNCYIIRIVHSKQEIHGKITFPSKNIECSDNKNVNFGINEELENFESGEKCLNREGTRILKGDYFKVYSLFGVDSLEIEEKKENLIFKKINCDVKNVSSEFELNSVEIALNQQNSKNILNLKTGFNRQESVSNLNEQVSSPQEVLNPQKSDENLQIVMKVEEKAIKLIECIDDNSKTKEHKWMMNKSLSKIPVPLSNASKGLRRTEEKSKSQAQKKYFKIDQVSNINCGNKNSGRSLCVDRTVFSSSCQELKEMSASKINERGSKIPVRKRKIDKIIKVEKNISNRTVIDLKLETLNAEEEENRKLEKSALEMSERENPTIKTLGKMMKNKLDSLIKNEKLKQRSGIENEISKKEKEEITKNEKVSLEVEKCNQVKKKGLEKRNQEIKLQETKEENVEKNTKIEKEKIVVDDFKDPKDSLGEERLDEEVKPQLSESLLKRTKGSAQTLKRFNKMIRETNPTIPEEPIPKIRLEKQGKTVERESQTLTVRGSSFSEENFISKFISRKRRKNHKKREQISEKRKCSSKMTKLNIQNIRTIVDLLLKSEINQRKKLIIVEGKKKLMKICEKGNKNDKIEYLNDEILPVFDRKSTNSEGDSNSDRQDDNNHYNDNYHHHQDDYYHHYNNYHDRHYNHDHPYNNYNHHNYPPRKIMQNDNNFRETLKVNSQVEMKSRLNPIFPQSQGNFETFEMLSGNGSLFNLKNMNRASWISQVRSRSRQSNGGKDEKQEQQQQLSNKISRTKETKNKINQIENCVGNSSLVNKLRREEFIRGIEQQQQSSESSERRVSDCKAHLEDFDSRKFTQMSNDSGTWQNL